MIINNDATPFTWGVATSAIQIEGAHNIDGKGANIWDHFLRRKTENHYIANEFYFRYKQDIDLVKSLNLGAFRFSISWSRIFPTLGAAANPLGVLFYHQVIDYCLENNIEPYITLYHWDLPQYLENIGGWTNREIVHHFTTFSMFCAKEYGNKVKHWMPLNEPLVFTSAGYLLGIHAPGKRGFSNFIPAVYHAILANAEAGRSIKAENKQLKVGSTFSLTPTVPHQRNAKDILASRKIFIVNKKILSNLDENYEKIFSDGELSKVPKN